jgi:hypothetical protein
MAPQAANPPHRPIDRHRAELDGDLPRAIVAPNEEDRVLDCLPHDV